MMEAKFSKDKHISRWVDQTLSMLDEIESKSRKHIQESAEFSRDKSCAKGSPSFT